MEKQIIFVKKTKAKKIRVETSVPIRIGIEEYEHIREIAEFTGKSITVIANQLLQFALAHSHLSNNENM